MNKGKNITWKNGKGETISFFIHNIEAEWENIKRRKGEGNFGEENLGLKYGDGEEYQAVWNFIPSCPQVCVSLT